MINVTPACYTNNLFQSVLMLLILYILFILLSLTQTNQLFSSAHISKDSENPLRELLT